MEITVRSACRIDGSISLPGDKSISHRAVILASIAEGKSRVENFLPSQDCLSTLECMRALGVEITGLDNTTLEIVGVGRGGLKESSDVLDAGNSGTTIRLLSGLLAGQPFFSVLSGDGSLRRRPMRRIIEPLRMMGAHITGRDQDRFAPIAITGAHLKGIEYNMKVASAQVKSAILLAGLYAQGQTVVREPAASRDHTERIMQFMGKALNISEEGIAIEGGGSLQGREVVIPGDISSAAYFLVAATIIGNSRLVLQGVGVNPTRAGILKALKKMGGQISSIDERMISNEPIADMEVQSALLHGTEISGEMIPRLIDELPVLAVAATQAVGTTIIRDAAELRVKETDRIRAMARQLSGMGANIEEKEDGWVIEGPTPLRGARCLSHGDHRIAMAMAVAGLIARGETYIRGAECVDISFPGFLSEIAKIAHHQR